MLAVIEKSTIAELAEAYTAGAGIGVLAKRFHMHTGTITRIVRDAGITVRKRARPRLKFDDVAIAADYAAGLSTDVLCEKYKCSDMVVRLRVHEQLGGMRQCGSKRKYVLDETFFDVIDTEAKAYWLGFIWADGSVTQSNGSRWLGLGLAACDIEHIRKMCADLKTDLPIRYYEKRNSATVHVTSKRICDALISHGIVPRKTYSDGLVTGVPQELLRHFYRGEFDGDGSIYSSMRSFRKDGLKIQNWKASVIGTPKFITVMQADLERELGLPPGKQTQYGPAVSVRYEGREKVFKLCNWLYDGATVYLQRKFDLYLQLKLQMGMKKWAHQWPRARKLTSTLPLQAQLNERIFA